MKSIKGIIGVGLALLMFGISGCMTGSVHASSVRKPAQGVVHQKSAVTTPHKMIPHQTTGSQTAVTTKKPIKVKKSVATKRYRLEQVNPKSSAAKRHRKSVSQSTTYKETKTHYTVKKSKHGKRTIKQQIIRKKTFKNQQAKTVKQPVATKQSTTTTETPNPQPTPSTPVMQSTTNQSTSQTTNQTSANPQPTISAADAQANQDAQNKNIQLQPALTQSQIQANQGQALYDVTGAASNVVGQGTAIVNTICTIISTIRNLF